MRNNKKSNTGTQMPVPVTPQIGTNQTTPRTRTAMIGGWALVAAMAFSCPIAQAGPLTIATVSGGVSAMMVDSSGTMWITTGDSVERFSPSNYSGTVTTFSNSAFSQGSGPTGLYGIAVDQSGNVYVSNGGYVSYVDEFQPGTLPSVTVDGNGTWTYFHNPGGLAVAPNGDVVVADSDSCRVDVFNPASFSSSFTSYGSCGSATGDVQNARSVAVDVNGDIFVADYNRIEEFNPSNFLGTFTTFAISNATGVSVDSNGNVYVANGSLWEFNPSNFSGSLTELAGSASQVAVDQLGNVFYSSGTQIDELAAGAPEPGTWMMTLIGVGAMAFGRIKRKRL